MSRVRRSALSLAAVVLGLSGCVHTTIGQPLSRDALADLVPGRTTGQEMRRLFGEPLHRARAGERHVWTWRYLDDQGRFQELVATLDEDVLTVWTDNRADW